MKKLALTIPGYTVTDPNNFKYANAPVNGLITDVLTLIITIAAFIMLFWMVWGVFQYIVAGGNKEQLGRARSRITWAIIGFLIVVMAFTITKFFAGIFQPTVNPLGP